MHLLDVSQADLDAAATGTRLNRFEDDVQGASGEISRVLTGARLLVVGGAGSIGGEVVESLVTLGAGNVVIVDHDENRLVEVTRRIRSRPGGREVALTTLPLDFGREPMARLLSDAEPFAVVLNFAALKHVRSEKDLYSLLQMIDTNVLAQVRLMAWIGRSSAPHRYFAVSTDKAAEPVSFMGATKRLMEAAIFTQAQPGTTVTSARFANVAFSAGSLLDGVLHRLRRRELVACPASTRRYFISGAEAASICLVGIAAAPPNHVVFPALDEDRDMPLVADIIANILERVGFKARFFENEDEARGALERGPSEGWQPVLLTSGRTEGEKPYERFYDEKETVVDLGLKRIRAVRYHGPTAAEVRGLVTRLSSAANDHRIEVTQADLESWIGDVLPQFRHAQGQGQLDAGV